MPGHLPPATEERGNVTDRIELPWDFVGPPAPGSRVKLNLPTPEGEELGRHMARFADQEAEKLSAAGLPVPQRCIDCAFRAGSIPSGCPPTIMTAIKCVFEREPFSCHHGLDADGEPTRICAGYELLTKGAE